MNIPYVLIKGGMYYAHNDCGYVSRAVLAEIYDKDYALNYAKQHEDITAKPITEILKSEDEIQDYIDRMQVMLKAVKWKSICEAEAEAYCPHGYLAGCPTCCA